MQCPIIPSRARVYRWLMRAVGVAVLIALLLSAEASAQAAAVAPPGNSSVSQYLETIPTAAGGRPTASAPPLGGPSSARLSPSVQHAFAREGPIGRKTEAVVSATAPPIGHRHGESAGAAGVPPQPPSAGAGGSGDPPASTLAKALTGSSATGGLGVLLPVILILIAISGGVLALLRRRRNT